MRPARAAQPVQRNAADSSKTVIPLPQCERTLQKYVKGQSIRGMAREEHRNFRTVSKIVKSEEIREHVCRMRERFYGLTETVLNIVADALPHDAALAYKLLEQRGVIPSERARLAAEIPIGAPVDDKERERALVEEWLLKFSKIAMRREPIFGHDPAGNDPPPDCPISTVGNGAGSSQKTDRPRQKN
jgi:hypothetical protein